jgi:hypothetical protein
MKYVVYISGPMTGKDDLNRPEFEKAAQYITETGCIALNPAVLPDGMTDAEYDRICDAMVESADAICLLSGWENSRGAKRELQAALWAMKRVFTSYYDIGTAVVREPAIGLRNQVG